MHWTSLFLFEHRPKLPLRQGYGGTQSEHIFEAYVAMVIFDTFLGVRTYDMF